MEDKGAGLVVLLTDCCSTVFRTPPVPTAPLETAPKHVPPRQIDPVLRCLFFQHRGTVDVTAAEDGTASYGDDQQGGVFTTALVRLLGGDLKTLDRNHDGFLSWKEFFPALSHETEDSFKSLAARGRGRGDRVEQRTQRPHCLSPLPDPPPSGPTSAPTAPARGNGRER
jgi:hypothetical protein